MPQIRRVFDRAALMRVDSSDYSRRSAVDRSGRPPSCTGVMLACSAAWACGLNRGADADGAQLKIARTQHVFEAYIRVSDSFALCACLTCL